MEADQALNEISVEIISCYKCILSKSRKNAVPGDGPADAEVMFIGEGPGFHENEQGLPFVGQAGKFLDELLESAGLNRNKVFITNVVKCRPPGNRDPQEAELKACETYLDQQIAIIDPLVIVTLGRFSMAKYFKNARISRIHGQAAWVQGRYIIPMYHPAAALHQRSLRPVIEKDFAKLPKMLEKARKMKSKINTEYPNEEGNAVDDATQLSFF